MRAALRLSGLLRSAVPRLASAASGLEPSTSSRVCPVLAHEPCSVLSEQRASFAAGRVDDEDIAEGIVPAKKARRPNTKTKPKSKAQDGKAAAKPPAQKESKHHDEVDRLERKEKIKALLKSQGPEESPDAAKAFIESFFMEEVYQGDTAAASLADEASSSVFVSELEEETGALELTAPDELTEEEEEAVLAGLQGLKRGSRRIVLQQLLQGKILDNDPEAQQEWAAIEASFAPPSGFRMRVVDVNRTAKGTQAGGLYRFGAMVVVGNGEGVLGWGQGKAAELQSAVRKAYARACSNLFPIPRFNNHTVPERVESKFGQVKMVVYPKAAGTGIVASEMIAGICKMAGIHDIGVKIHGSRNRRNAVKCLFEAFDKMRTHEEILSQPDKIVLARPPGRFAAPRA